jgi:flagellar hook protein FlgE
MGIQSAMFSGVSGLNSNSQAMSVIGNNLANTNTLGFKGSRTVFSDLLSSSISGSGGSSQVGRGVGLSTIDSLFSQGTFETTSTNTDVAIEGDGFFVLKEAGDDTAYYSRSGAFRFNADGYLVNPEGYRVQGKEFDSTNNTELLAADPTNIRVANVGLTGASPTTALTFTTNLDENSTELGGSATDIDPTDKTTYNYSASSQIYDSLGESHLLSVYWRLVSDSGNSWESAYTVDNDVTTLTALGGSPLTFDSQGELPDTTGDSVSDPVTVAITIPAATWGNGAAASSINLSFDCTQYDSDSIVIGQDQNGYAAGELTGVSIDSDGIVVASYSNSKQINIAQLVLTKFQNTGGLELAGSNLYTASSEVGTIRTGIPGAELGKIFTNSLEQSNVDMGQEFVKMITTQRGFSANSKIITTVDEMLSELINLKR